MIEHIPSDKKDERIQQLYNTATDLCGQTKCLLADGNSDDSGSDSEDENDSDALGNHSPSNKMKNLVQSIKLYTDCLMDLGSTLDCPAFEPEHKGPPNVISLKQRSAWDSYVAHIAKKLSSAESCMDKSSWSDIPREVGSDIDSDSQSPTASALVSKQQSFVETDVSPIDLPDIHPTIETAGSQSRRAPYAFEIKSFAPRVLPSVVNSPDQSDNHPTALCPIPKPDGSMCGHQMIGVSA
jgi:hypothetical protein